MNGIVTMLTGKCVAAVVVPGTQGVARNPALQIHWRDEITKVLARSFGGATSIAGNGGYIRQDNGKLETEPVYVVFSFTDEKGLAKHRDTILKSAAIMGQNMAQETVGVILGGEFMMVNIAASMQRAAVA